MKFFINLILINTIIISPISIAEVNAVKIYHAFDEKMEAFWINEILVKHGIPEDFIAREQTQNPCTRQKISTSELLVLCIDNRKKLHILNFNEDEFFWQFKPLIN